MLPNIIHTMTWVHTNMKKMTLHCGIIKLSTVYRNKSVTPTCEYELFLLHNLSEFQNCFYLYISSLALVDLGLFLGGGAKLFFE